MSGISRNLDGPYAAGVPNPYTAHVHPYPTRFHGAIYTRPTFGMPYVRRPHAVFKPDDFYSYYGVNGLGGFAGSSLGNGSVGGNSLGLGATGTPIYWHGFNTKVQTLQGGLNKVLSENRFHEIDVDGKLGALTCAALGLVKTKYPEELAAQVPAEIVSEATRICDVVLSKYPSIKSEVAAHMTALVQNRPEVAPEPLVAPPTPTPVETAPVATPAPPQAAPPPTAPAVPPVVPPVVNQPVEIPEMEVSARPPVQEHSGRSNLTLGLIVVAAAGAGYYFWRKR